MTPKQETIMRAIWSLSGKVDRDVYLSAVVAVSKLDAQEFAASLLPLVHDHLVAYEVTRVHITQQGLAKMPG